MPYTLENAIAELKRAITGQHATAWAHYLSVKTLLAHIENEGWRKALKTANEVIQKESAMNYALRLEVAKLNQTVVYFADKGWGVRVTKPMQSRLTKARAAAKKGA